MYAGKYAAKPAGYHVVHRRCSFRAFLRNLPTGALDVPNASVQYYTCAETQEKHYYIEAQKDSVRDFLKCRTIGVRCAQSDIMLYAVRKRRPQAYVRAVQIHLRCIAHSRLLGFRAQGVDKHIAHASYCDAQIDAAGFTRRAEVSRGPLDKTMHPGRHLLRAREAVLSTAGGQAQSEVASLSTPQPVRFSHTTAFLQDWSARQVCTHARCAVY